MDQDLSEFGNIKIEIDVAEEELLERRHEETEKDQMTGTNHYCISINSLLSLHMLHQ
jgi:hypothetical protein